MLSLPANTFFIKTPDFFMKKIVLATTMIAVALLASAWALSEKNKEGSNEIKWMTMEEAVKQSEKDGKSAKKIFVDIYTDWCGWCKVMDRETFADPSVAKLMSKYYYCVKFNAEQKADINIKGRTYKYIAQPNGRGYHELAGELLNGQMSYPTVVFLDENSGIIQAIPGFRKKDELGMIASYFGGNFHKNTDWGKFQQNYKPEF